MIWAWGSVCPGPAPAPPDPPLPGCGGGSGQAGNDNQKPGSIIGCDSQSLGEQAQVSGTPHALHYSSSRMPGAVASKQTRIALTGAQVHSQASVIRVNVAIAGQRHQAEFVPIAPATTFAPNLSWTFTWDGLDAAGRAVVGTQVAWITVTTHYKAKYARVEYFGQFPSESAALVADPRAFFAYTRATGVPLTARVPDAGWSLGGWTLDSHHFYDVASNTLYFGSGKSRPAEALLPMVSRVLGDGGSIGFAADGQSALTPGTGLDTGTGNNGGVAVAANGDVFVADSSRHVVRRIDAKTGLIRTVAGTANGNSCATSPPNPNDNAVDATTARLSYPEALTVGPDGSLYILSKGTVRKATPKPDGKYSIATVAGTHCVWTVSAGEGVAATSASLKLPLGIALGPDGSIYIAEAFKVRRVDPAGIITTFAGNGAGGLNGGDRANEGKLASTVPVSARDVAVGLDGTVYIASAYTLVSVDPNGALHYLNAPPGSPRVVGDGVPLKTASLDGDCGTVAVRPDGSVAFNDGDSARHYVRSVNPSGIVTTLSASPNHVSGPYPVPPALGLALQNGPWSGISIAAAPDGDILTVDSKSIYRIETVTARSTAACSDVNAKYMIPNGDEGFCFDANGRHLKTIDVRTGQPLLTFGYVGGGLASITDRASKIITVNKLTTPTRYEVIAPFGQKTTIKLDSTSGYATSIEDGLGALALVPFANGLLDNLTDRNGNFHDFSFDAAGFLLSDANALGTQTLSRALVTDGRKVTHKTPLLRATTYETVLDPARVLRHTTTFPDLSTELKASHPNGLETTTARDKTITSTKLALDPRFGKRSLVPSTSTVTLPSTAPSLSSTTWTAVCQPSGTTTKTQVTGIAIGSSPLACDATTPSVLQSSPPPHTKVVRTYNSSGQTITTTSPEGRPTTLSLDAAGRVVSTTIGNLTPVFSDLYASGEFLGKPWKQRQGAREWVVSYQAKGTGTAPAGAGYANLLTDALGQKTGVSRDLFGRAKTQVDAKDTLKAASTAFDWDGNGNLKLVTPPGKPTHNLLYNAINGLATYTPPDVLPSLTGTAKVTTYTPTADRALGTEVQPGNVQVVRSYITTPVNTGQLDNITFPGGLIDYNYFPNTHATAAGKVSTILGPYGVDLAFTYNGFLKTAETWSGAAWPNSGDSVTWAYKNQSLLLDSETVASVPIYFGYDNDTLLTCAATAACTAPPPTGALVLARSSQHGSVTSITLGNVTETIEYSDTAADLPSQAFGELRRQTVKFGTTTIAEFEYDALNRRRDNLGRIKFKKEILRNPATGLNETRDTEYGYDELNRLKTVKLGTAAAELAEYDANGNLTRYTPPTGLASDGVYDNQDRLVSLGNSGGSNSFAYGLNGEMKTKTSTSPTGGTLVFTSTYDALGSLKSMKFPAAVAGGQLLEYLVDGRGRRVGRKVNGTLTKRWIYRDGLNPVAEYNGTGALISRFVYGSRPNVPDFVLRGGNTYRIIVDHLGSPRMAVNVNNLNDIPYRVDYAAAGSAIPVAGTLLDWMPFGFAGGMYDVDTKLVRFGARDYDPQIGRWVSKDPSRFRGGINLYVYSWNDPVNFLDRTGRRPTGAGGASNSGEGGGEGTSGTGSGPSTPVPGMPFDLPFGPSRDEHANRNSNSNNRCPEHPPAACGGGIDDDFSYDEMFGKYRGSAGNECAYDSNGNLLPDPNQTFNFYPDPYTAGHGWSDFGAHYWYGGGDGYSPDLTTSY